ncbi:TonB-dependent receptor plug domain-containing protein [Vibrio sp. NTOU-M3]|uniref:TonB-dependent receptor plug domain-containing protein n=1 Tax=Vibrio sp. NTOU-M3 TaxID=3234954 RepID=UPI00349F1AC0
MPNTKLSPLILLLVSVPVYSDDSLEHLMSLSLEELSMLETEMQISSKFSQKLSEIPASVYVLDHERIQRSGVRSIAEALALVPGLNVTKASETTPIVSSRGFHDGFYNKMLVLIDGRSLYSPVYGGVHWRDVDYILPDIDRIEVLRGPGGSIWGGNAVNGVINIITKPISETQNTLATTTVDEKGGKSISVRTGLAFNENTSAKAFYKYRDQKVNFDYPAYSMEQHLAGMSFEGKGANLDWNLDLGVQKNTWLYDNLRLHFTPVSYEGWEVSRVEGVNQQLHAQLGVSSTISDTLISNYRVGISHRDEDAIDGPGSYTLFDAEVNFRNKASDQHILTYGGGYRFINAHFNRTVEELDIYNIDVFSRSYELSGAKDSTLNAYIQSEYEWNDSFKTVAGAKAEYFEYTNAFELSPQLRALYQLDKKNTLWAGIGRAVTSPSYIDNAAHYYPAFTLGNFLLVEDSKPNSDMGTESVVTTELGYRRIAQQYELDITLFYSEHEDVRGVEDVGWSPDYLHVFETQITDAYSLRTYGAEVGAQWQLSKQFRTFLSYSYFKSQSQWDGRSDTDGSAVDLYKIDDHHLVSLQGLWDISKQWQLDFVARGQSISYPESSIQIPNYLALDVRLAWQYDQSAPLIEFMVKNLGEQTGYYMDGESYWFSYGQEQLVYLRASYEF